MNFFPTRKLMGIGRRSSYAKRDRLSSLHDYLEEPRAHGCWRRWFILLLLAPALYYLGCAMYFSKPGTYRYFHVVEQYAKTVQRFANKTKVRHHIVMDSQVEKRDIETNNSLPTLPVCIIDHTQLGKISVNKTRLAILADKLYPMVKKGGYYAPSDCQSRHKVGILVPYRDRSTNLAVFLYNIHPFLINQKLEYRIFVVEQFGKELFNKGRLYNAGFKELQKFGQWKCVVFQDVDLLPLDARIMYTCPTYPRHMCGTVLEKKNDPNYHLLFGGVTSMTPEHYQKANGYSNMYWGWGGEDNDMFWRLRAARLPVVRYNRSIAQYTALPHAIRHKNRHRFQLLHTAMARAKDEGLSTVEYKVVGVTMHHLYTHLLVNVNPYTENVTGLTQRPVF